MEKSTAYLAWSLINITVLIGNRNSNCIGRDIIASSLQLCTAWRRLLLALIVGVVAFSVATRSEHNMI